MTYEEAYAIWYHLAAMNLACIKAINYDEINDIYKVYIYFKVRDFPSLEDIHRYGKQGDFPNRMTIDDYTLWESSLKYLFDSVHDSLENRTPVHLFLDNYEAASLLGVLKNNPQLDSGDWHHQIIYKLEAQKVRPDEW